MKYLKTSILSIFILLYASFVFAATYYIDNTNSSGNLTSATGWTFVNASATVTCPAAEGDANNEIDNGDYVRANGGTQWYKVTARDAGGDSITIDPAFQQANVGPVACNYQDVSVKNGTSTANAWCHPALFTTDTARTAGDIGDMRANQTHVLAGKDLVADEDGSISARIQLRGCTNAAGGNDPFNDNDDTHVTFDFSDTAFQCLWNADDYWQFENIDFIQSADGNGAFYLLNSAGSKFIDSVFRDSSVYGLYVVDSRLLGINDCAFYSNTSYNLRSRRAIIKINNSIFNGGSGTIYGIYLGAGIVYLEDCTFGVTTAHTTADIFVVNSGHGIARRCIFTTITVPSSAPTDAPGSYFKSEDHDQVEGAHKSYYWNGTIEKETTEVRSGGASTSIKGTPNANCVANFPLTLMEWEEQAVPASAQTRGVCIKQGLADPSSFPTNTELYLEAEYYDHATNDTVTTAVSTDTISTYDTWTWFSATFTPAQVQKVRYRVILKTIEGAEAYYVDNQLYNADPL